MLNQVTLLYISFITSKEMDEGTEFDLLIYPLFQG